jgi:chemotaxis protein histidine kinase CheA
MNLDPAPRQSKLLYLAIDAGLLITAFIIVFFAEDPYAPLPFVCAVLCVVLAAIIGLVPFLIDYAADSAEYVQAERGRVAEQVQRLHAAGESLARAAAQIKAVEEAVHKTAHAAENLPYRMQEKLAEFNEALAAKDNDDREALERELEELRAANSSNLKTAAEKITKATTEWTALEAAHRKSLDAAQDATAKLTDRLHAALAQLDTRIAGLNKAAASAPSPVAAVYDRREASSAPTAGGHRPPRQPEPETPPAPVEPAKAVEGARPEPVEELIESVTLTENTAPPARPEPAETAAEEPKPKKPRAPRKPKPEDTLAAMSLENPEKAEPASSENGRAESAPASAASDESASAVEESPARAESSASSDGATRLLVTAYIGIGNKLYLRGEGPGLSWDKGVPMQFVSIGKWGWASHEASGPVKCKLFKNDDTAALSGEVILEPGKHVEVTALF